MRNDFDLSRLPQAVQDSLIQLIQTLAESWEASEAVILQDPSPTLRHTTRRRMETSLVPCVHGTPAVPCCAACTVVDAAEGIITASWQTRQQPDFPRSETERPILETLKEAYPASVPVQDLAAVAQLTTREMVMLCGALRLLGTIELVPPGFRYQPPTPDKGV